VTAGPIDQGHRARRDQRRHVSSALVLMGLYLVMALSITGALFRRRDVAA
jgi:hypothetical protein